MKNIWRAVKFIPEYRGRVAGVICVGTVLGAIGVLTPQIYKLLVDVLSKLISGRLTHDEAVRQVGLLVAVFFGLRLGIVLFTALQDKQADDLSEEAHASALRRRHRPAGLRVVAPSRIGRLDAPVPRPLAGGVMWATSMKWSGQVGSLGFRASGLSDR